MHKILDRKNCIHLELQQIQVYVPPVALCTCMYTCYYSLPNAGEIEISLEVPHMMKRAWPENSCWTPSEQVWAKLLLGRKGMSVLKHVL